MNCELVPEYAKEHEWEGRTGKIRQAQDYIFAKQHFRLSRLIGEVDVIITDAPLMLSQIYTPKDYLPSRAPVLLGFCSFQPTNLGQKPKKTGTFCWFLPKTTKILAEKRTFW